MLREVAEHLKASTSLEKIYFVLFDAKVLSEFEKAWTEIAAAGDLQGKAKASRQ
jgi:hypothetical protein